MAGEEKTNPGEGIASKAQELGQPSGGDHGQCTLKEQALMGICAITVVIKWQNPQWAQMSGTGHEKTRGNTA